MKRNWLQNQKRLYKVATSVIIASLPALFLITYTVFCFITDPYLRIWAAQNRLPAAPISHYLLSYGWLVPFLFCGINKMLKLENEKGLLLLIWIGTASMLIFTPVSIQRRLIEGVWVVIILISLFYLELRDAMPRGRYLLRGLAYLLICCALPASLLLVWGGVQSALYPNSPIFIPEREAVGYEALHRFERAKNAVVLASYESSNALPAYAFVRVIIGHGPESPFGNILAEEVRTFYQAETLSVFRRDFIRQHHIQYVIWGENEKKLGDWQPNLDTNLIPVYENESLVIFEIDRAKMEY